MRSIYALLLSASLASVSALAAADDPPPAPFKPIKLIKPVASSSSATSTSASASASTSASAPASAAKETVGSLSTAIKEKEKEQEEAKPKPGSKEARAAAAARAREQGAADDLAAKIAERLAQIRREKEEAVATGRSIPRPTHKVATFATPAQKTLPDPKPETVVGTSLHWSYDGDEGPLRWGRLNPLYSKCDNGERQSPIDIRDGIKVDLDAINFDYKPSRFNVIDNGHTVQVNVAPGNYISLLGHGYELQQFHFHRPSEEKINGRGTAMVVHLVHKDADGKLAVVAVLIDPGKAQNIIQLVWNNLPLEKNTTVQPLVTMDLNQLLPEKRDYYTYMGSLTTPPCTEGVLWLVMKQPIEASSDQIDIFGRLYPMNARPVQKTDGRMIKESR